jgi:hypothetical protein
MKQYKLFEAALNTMFWSWGSEPEPEVVWAGNEFLTWIESEYDITLQNRFEELTQENEYEGNFEAVLAELKLKLDKS